MLGKNSTKRSLSICLMLPVCVLQGATVSPSTGVSVFCCSCGHQQATNVVAPWLSEGIVLSPFIHPSIHSSIHSLHICKHWCNQIECIKKIFSSSFNSPCSNFKSHSSFISRFICLQFSFVSLRSVVDFYRIWTLRWPPGMQVHGTCQNRFPSVIFQLVVLSFLWKWSLPRPLWWNCNMTR